VTFYYGLDGAHRVRVGAEKKEEPTNTTPSHIGKPRIGEKKIGTQMTIEGKKLRAPSLRLFAQDQASAKKHDQRKDKKVPIKCRYWVQEEKRVLVQPDRI